MKIGKWGEMSRGETSFGEKRRTCANFGKKWGEMIFGEKRHREKFCEVKHLFGRNVAGRNVEGRNVTWGETSFLHYLIPKIVLDC